MLVSLIVAMDEKGGIGKDGRMPWHLGADLKRFKRLTMGHHLIMGRKTYDSIGRQLPGRTMLVVSRNPHFEAKGVIALPSLEDAIKRAEEDGDNEAFIIGGGEIFRQALPLADRIYLTRVHAVTDADTFFPPLPLDGWRVKTVEGLPADVENDYDSEFVIMDRK